MTVTDAPLYGCLGRQIVTGSGLSGRGEPSYVAVCGACGSFGIGLLLHIAEQWSPEQSDEDQALAGTRDFPAGAFTLQILAALDRDSYNT